MASKNSREANGAAGKKDLLLFDPEALTIVDVDEKNPLFDERAKLEVDERLVLNIMHHGVLEPVLVRKNTANGKVEVVAGRQRVRACREANKRLVKQGAEPHRIPAVVKRAEDGAVMGMMISENEIRRDDSPLGRAKKLTRFLELGRTEEEAAVVFGVSAATVKNLLGVLDAIKPVQAAVERGEIRLSDAYKLARLETDEQRSKLEELKAEAPIKKGSKRRKGADRARKILDGASIHGKREIAAKLGEVAKCERMKEMHRAGAEAALKWVLGEGADLESLMA
jgi:ParB family chromosome partitioning protein